ncbi:MAG: glucose-6-phosphate isomerase [Alphaproteobacteria bacterium]
MVSDSPFRHDISDCLAANIGAGGLSDAAYRSALADAEAVLEGLRDQRDKALTALFGLPGRDDDLAGLEAVADRYRERFDDVVVLGAGGSSLGGQTVTALAAPGQGPRLHFMDNIDPGPFEALLGRLDLAATGYLTISKSGSTAETLAQTLICMGAAPVAIADHFTAIVEPSASPLRRLAEGHGMTLLDHDPHIAGRFSVLSLVGVLPALIAGLEVRALRAGASAVLEAALAAPTAADCAPAAGGAVSVGLLREHGATTTVLMPYAEALEPFARWFRQLWAESLGKGGCGTTPAAAMGVTDQHSQLQLYLDGPRDKMFTLITTARDGAGPVMPEGLSNDPELAYLEGRSLGDLMAAEQRATADTLARGGHPLRRIELDGLQERSLGGLLMHFMLETIIAAGLMGVDPFGQPAVEQGKQRARDYLAESKT